MARSRILDAASVDILRFTLKEDIPNPTPVGAVYGSNNRFGSDTVHPAPVFQNGVPTRLGHQNGVILDSFDGDAIPEGTPVSLAVKGVYAFSVSGVTPLNRDEYIYLDTRTNTLHTEGALAGVLGATIEGVDSDDAVYRYGVIWDVESVNVPHVLIINPVFEAEV